ncbi:MAG TPA: hypothetical protein VFR84_16660 [Candidatus Angelobacter sp.]|nr:hypothetical protein [Candidatus Angelobacter sp.]
MRRLVPSLVCLAFAATLHASSPDLRQEKLSPAPAKLQVEPAERHALPLTAAPADHRSFYTQFYSAGPLPAKTTRKGGLLHWFTSAVKKTAQKVSFFN